MCPLILNLLYDDDEESEPAARPTLLNFNARYGKHLSQYWCSDAGLGEDEKQRELLLLYAQPQKHLPEAVDTSCTIDLCQIPDTGFEI